MRCEHPKGEKVTLCGADLDPCLYEETEVYKNVTVRVLRCKYCGHTEIEWERQDNTEEVW